MIRNRRNRERHDDAVVQSQTSRRLAGLVRPAWYRASYLSAEAELTDPAADFVGRGHLVMLDPNPLFDSWWYREVHGLSSVGEPVDHYLDVGAHNGLDPSPVFDSNWYLRQVGELPESVTPLEHYLTVGGFAGIDPHPLFSTAWYLQQCSDDLGELTPLEHFLSNGWRQGFDPCSLFSSAGYLLRNPDVAAGDVNPFIHYLKYGQSEGREGTALWTEAEYREWFADDVLVHRLGSLAHYRVSVVPDGGVIEASPAIDRVARSRVESEMRVGLWVEVGDGGISTPHCDWSARRDSLKISVSENPEVAVVLAGVGSHLIQSLEDLSELSHRHALEILAVGQADGLPMVAGVQYLKGMTTGNWVDVVAAVLSSTSAPTLVFLSEESSLLPGSLDALLRRLESDPTIAQVGSVIVDGDFRMLECGRLAGSPASHGFGSGDRVGHWMFGTAHDVEECDHFGSIYRRQLLSEWVSETDSATSDEVAPLLARHIRSKNLRIVVEPRSILLGRSVRNTADAREQLPRVEQLRRRDHRRGRHILVLDSTVPSHDHAGADNTLLSLFDALGESGFNLHLLTADGFRRQPSTELFERSGIEVIDSPLGSSELVDLFASLIDQLDFVLLCNPLSATRWLSFVLEHLPGVPLVYDARTVDGSVIAPTSNEAAIVRVADVTLCDSPEQAEMFRIAARSSEILILDVHAPEGTNRSDLVDRLCSLANARR